MREKFANEFVTRLDGKIPDDELKLVLQELQMFVNNYDINDRPTSVIPYNQIYPECYKVYMISKKIEGLSPETLKTYDFYLRDFFEYIGKGLTDITTNDIRIYLYNLPKRRNITERSLDGKRLVINTFMDWCQGEGYISKNPCKLIKPIKYETKPREPLTGIEMEMVRDACETHREKAIVELLYSTGCRVSELARLRKEDIDFVTGEVHLYGKGRKHRISYLNARAQYALKKYYFLRNDDSPGVIISNRRPYQSLAKPSIEAIVRRIGERSGIGRPLYPHLIRHTTATDALDRGMNVAELQSLLGHEKLDTTMIYAKVSGENVRHNHKKYIV